MPRSRGKRLKSHRFFFPAASFYAAIALPLSMAAMLAGWSWTPGLAGSHHGHEMIFGFALAVIAGYTLGPQPIRWLAPLFGLWLTARFGYALAPGFWFSQLLSPAFALLLAWRVVPRFNAAKKWRNRMLVPLMVSLCGLPLLWLVLPAIPVPRATTLLQTGVTLLLLLMTFMSGRLIAPAVTGTLEKRGITQEARVQPRIEAALILLLGLAAALTLLSLPLVPVGSLLLAAAVLILIRTLRWRLWLCLDRPDLLGLALGTLWLAAGALGMGMTQLLGRDPSALLHLITVGALGTLTIGVMLRIHYHAIRRQPPPSGILIATLTPVAVATLARLAAGPVPWNMPGPLWTAAAAWSLAYAITAGVLLLRS
ncbi:NnrS family protein [Vreelandella utahensis]|uniref:NnrS family protein n=1 Tax=Vreelandella halophila TaxID=86177 RepID=UPI00098691B4|nr:NnrS family protein [Halomonas utahensis]